MVLLDRPMGHPTKIEAVVVGIISAGLYNILLTNGYGKGNIKRVKSFEISRGRIEANVQSGKKRS